MIIISWEQKRGDWHSCIHEINLLYAKKNSYQKKMCQILKFLSVHVHVTLQFQEVRVTLDAPVRDDVIRISVVVSEMQNFAILNAMIVYHVLISKKSYILAKFIYFFYSSLLKKS